MTYNSIQDFVDAQLRAFNEIRDVDKVLREAVLDSIVLVKDRIQQRGQKSDGSTIGRYKKSWATYRAKFGRQTERVDLTFTGDLMRDFTIIPDGADSLGIGFNSNQQGQIARYNETHFGGTIFELANDEEQFISDKVANKVYAILTRTR